MCDLTVDQLMFHANELSQKHWGVDYTGTIELTNRMWKYSNGKYFTAKHNKDNFVFPKKNVIIFSRKRNSERTIPEVLGTLLHELVHWRLFTTGANHYDRDFDFIAECLRVGAPISKSTSAQAAYNRYMSAL